jgi:hypothetical protein
MGPTVTRLPRTFSLKTCRSIQLPFGVLRAFFPRSLGAFVSWWFANNDTNNRIPFRHSEFAIHHS